MMRDEARFAERPDVDAVAAARVAEAAKQPVPIETAEYERNYRFYLIKFPFDLRPSGPWSFNELKVNREDESNRARMGVVGDRRSVTLSWETPKNTRSNGISSW